MRKALIVSGLVGLLLSSNAFTGYLLYESERKVSAVEKDLSVKTLAFENSEAQYKKMIEETENDNTILNERVAQLTEKAVAKEVSSDAETPNDDSPNTFTLGSSMAHVKKVMGTPKSIQDFGAVTWWTFKRYSIVRFDTKTGLVIGWDDIDNVLKVE